MVRPITDLFAEILALRFADDFTLASGLRFTMDHWLIVVLNVTFDRIVIPARLNPPWTALIFRNDSRNLARNSCFRSYMGG
jgi:hypothetical protein